MSAEAKVLGMESEENDRLKRMGELHVVQVTKDALIYFTFKSGYPNNPRY